MDPLFDRINEHKNISSQVNGRGSPPFPQEILVNVYLSINNLCWKYKPNLKGDIVYSCKVYPVTISRSTVQPILNLFIVRLEGNKPITKRDYDDFYKRCVLFFDEFLYNLLQEVYFNQ